jgi:hypothetical protein
MNLEVKDLIQKCQNCNGGGSIEDPPPDTKQGSYGVHRAGSSTKETCHPCRGSGEVLTEAGEAVAKVVELLKKQHKI